MKPSPLETRRLPSPRTKPASDARAAAHPPAAAESFKPISASFGMVLQRARPQ